MSVNKVILLGNLGKDPELRYSAGQMAIASFSVATNERKKDQSGQWVDHTEWHNIVVFGKTAENCANFLKKGRQAYIEGSIRTRKWQDKEGKDRYTTEILANTVQFIGGRDGTGTRSSGAGDSMNDDRPGDTRGSAPVAMPNLATADAVAANGGSAPAPAFDDDDIPF
jgi:single-strand DNA-binding protein